MVGSGNFIRSRPAALLASAADELETLSLRSPPRRTASLLTADNNMHTSASGANLPSSRSRGFLGDGLCLTDVNPAVRPKSGWRSSWTRSNAGDSDGDQDVPDDASLIADLNFLVGTEDGDPTERSFDSSFTDDQLPSHLRRQLQSYTEDQLRNGVVLHDHSPDATPKQHFRRIRKTNRDNGNRETVYEITTEIIETIETVTTVEQTHTSSRSRTPTHEASISPLSPIDMTAPLPPSKSGMLRRDVTSSKSVPRLAPSSTVERDQVRRGRRMV